MKRSRSFGPSSSFPSVVALGLLALVACGPKNAPPPEHPTEPVAAAPEPKAEPAAQEAPEAAPTPEPTPEAAPAAPATKVPEGSLAVGTFNLEWAFDDIDQKRPAKAQPNIPPDDVAWIWKRDRIAEILAAERLDVVVLTELGGERELSDIVLATKDKKGYHYEYAWVESGDRYSGQQVAILSRFPVSEERRFDVKVPLHVAADIELPGGQKITVIAVHLKEGKHKGATDQRQMQSRSIRRMVNHELKQRPVIIAGTVASKSLPADEDYEGTAPHTLTGKKGCTDSATEPLARPTTVEGGEALDRIIVCKMELEGAEIAAEDRIVRGDKDPSDAPWPTVPVDDGAKRDVSDHLLLWAEVVMPKKAE